MARHRSFHLALCARAGDLMLDHIRANIERGERYQLLRGHGSRPRDGSGKADSEHDAIVAACGDRNVGAAVGQLAHLLARTALDALNDIARTRDPALIRHALLLIDSGLPGLAAGG